MKQNLDQKMLTNTSLNKACAHTAQPCSLRSTPQHEEVAKLPATELESLMAQWLWDSPKDALPTKLEVNEIIDQLLYRPDLKELRDLIDECHYYVSTC